MAVCKFMHRIDVWTSTKLVLVVTAREGRGPGRLEDGGEVTYPQSVLFYHLNFYPVHVLLTQKEETLKKYVLRSSCCGSVVNESN